MTIVRLLRIQMIIIAVTAAAASAQDGTSTQGAPGRHGIWFTSGIAGGWGLLSEPDPGIGKARYLRIGGTPSRRFRLGAEFIGYWVHRSDMLASGRGNLACVAQYFPIDGTGFYVKGALGLAMRGDDYEMLPGVVGFREYFGVGTSLGVGLEIPLMGWLALTPGVDWLGGLGFADERGSYSALLLALGITLGGR